METIILIIINIVATSLMGLVNALFSYLLDYCMWPGSIFGKWQPFVATALASYFYKEDFTKIMREPREAQDESFIQLIQTKGSLLFKFLGGCIICVNVWIGIVSWLAIWHFTGLFHPAYGFVYILVGNAFLRKLMGVVYH